MKLVPHELFDGKYTVEREIGSGAMGIVVAAKSAKPGGRVPVGTSVAIKVMLPELAKNPELVQRFMREAVAAVRLRSEHVTRVLDVGRHPEGSPYMVMELLQGAVLTEVLAQSGPLPISRAVGYLLQVCDALSEAHAMGIVHRDLKLENIFLEQVPGRVPRIKVLDFGLAKLTAPGNLKLTGSRVTMGSPQYMSPEQLRSAADVDFGTDIWSLGVCLYEMLTCSMPFEATSMPMLFLKILDEKHTPILDRRAGIPAEIGTIIDRCLEKERAKRWASVEELAKALRPYARVDAAATIPQSQWRKMQEAQRRPRRLLLLTALLLPPILVFGAVITYLVVSR